MKLRDQVAIAVDTKLYELIEDELEKIDPDSCGPIADRAEYIAMRMQQLQGWRENAIKEVTADLMRRTLN